MWNSLKRIGELLQLIAGLRQSLPIVLGFVVLVSSVLVWLTGIGNITVEVKIPLIVGIAIIALAVYPIAKAIQWWMKSPEPFDYSGLSWKPSRLGFRYPAPMCPVKNCDLEVICLEQPPPPIQFFGGVTGNRLLTEYTYIYECPIHGRLGNVPNVDIKQLQYKAQLVQHQKRNR